VANSNIGREEGQWKTRKERKGIIHSAFFITVTKVS
jgi:hypothetical protein